MFVNDFSALSFDIDSQNDCGALQEGILRDLFLFIDQQRVQTLLSSMPNVDDEWVYAVDSDFPPSTNAATDSNLPTSTEASCASVYRSS